MAQEAQKYTFPWGFHLGDLSNNHQTIPLYTPSNDGGFSLIYDKASEPLCDTLLESLVLELLSSMPHKSLMVDLFDFGQKKFYSLSPLQYLETYRVSYTKEMIEARFSELEAIIISRHQELLCCNRQTIQEHNQKSRMKQNYHLLLLNLAHFPHEEVALRRVKNFLESSIQAGFYVIAFGYDTLLEEDNEPLQTILKHYKSLKVSQKNFQITEEIFEFMELLHDHQFKSLDLDKSALLEKIMANANIEGFMDPSNIKLETNTKV